MRFQGAFGNSEGVFWGAIEINVINSEWEAENSLWRVTRRWLIKSIVVKLLVNGLIHNLMAVNGVIYNYHPALRLHGMGNHKSLCRARNQRLRLCRSIKYIVRNKQGATMKIIFIHFESVN
jgi:hypothetical protein